MPITIDDLNELIRLLDEHPDWQEALASRLLTEQTLQRVLQANPELRATVRRMILDEEFLQLPAIVRELVEVTRQLVDRVGRVEERVAGVEERTERIDQHVEGVENRLERVEQRMEGVENRLERVEQRVEGVEQRMEGVENRLERVEERLIRVEDGVDDWKQWRRGEEGRREGERYERKILRRASRLLGGGEGGSPEEESVRRRLASVMARLADVNLDEESDPALADLIWWKGERMVVVEVSLKVNGLDVLRAKQRTEALRRAGIDAMPLVIGEEWAHPETQALAQQEGVEWLVAKEASPGLVEYRRIVPERTE